MKGYTVDQVLEAVKGSAGITTMVAQKLGCDWHTAAKYVDRWEKTRLAFKAERNTLLDLGESELAKAVQNHEEWAIKFILMTLGKSRGFTTRQELTGEDGNPIAATFLAPKRFESEDEWQAHATHRQPEPEPDPADVLEVGNPS